MPKIGPRVAFVIAALVLAGFRPKEDHVIAAGEGRFAIDGKEMSVHVDSERMALYGTNFHVAADESLNCFGAPSAQLMICSFGKLGMQIDGKVFSQVGLTLVSPAGISFGPIAEIQALQNFTAVAGRLDTADFMAGRLYCSHLDGKILNEGKIEVGAEAIFVAGHVENIGSIAADTITWVTGNSVYIGSETEHMRVRLTHDKEINAGHTPFANRGSLTAKGRVAFRSGDPYTQAFIQNHQGSIEAEEVSIDAPSKVLLRGTIDASNITIHRVSELSLGHLKLPSRAVWDLSAVGAMLVSGPFSAKALGGKIYSEARFGKVDLTEGLDLDMPRGVFFSGDFTAGRFRLNAREWNLAGSAHVSGLLDISKVPLQLKASSNANTSALSSDQKLKLGRLSAQGSDLRLSSPQIELTDRMEGLSKLHLSEGVATLDQAHIEAGVIDAQVPLTLRSKSELLGRNEIRLGSVHWENEATLRLRTAGDLYASCGFGQVGHHTGALVVEESKNFVCGGPISLRSMHLNSHGHAHTHGSVRAPGGIYMRAGGDLIIAGDCTASAVEKSVAPAEGAGGGSVYLESEGGDVSVHNVETSGGRGVERGGDAGAISIFQSNALDCVGVGAYTPKSRAHLLGWRYVARGGSGKRFGADGDVKIGSSTPHFPDRCPVVFKRGVLIAGGDLTFGFNTAVGFRENANLALSGSLYLSDMLVIGDLNLDTKVINVYPHEVGKIALSNGSLVNAGPTQMAVLGSARSSAQSIRLAPAIGYESLEIDAKNYATAYAMPPQRRALIQQIVDLEDGSMTPPLGRIHLYSMTPSMALIAPLPELMGHPPELQRILNDAAAPIEILAEMITSSLAFDTPELVKWEEIRSDIMQTHENPASIPIERYQQRLRYAIFEPKRFVNRLGHSVKGRSALAFIKKVRDLIDELKAQKNSSVALYLERFSQPPEITRERWQQILKAVKAGARRPGNNRLSRPSSKVSK